MTTIPHQLELMLAKWENDDALLLPAYFRQRVEILDQLDACFPDASPSDAGPTSQLLTRARSLATRLDSANAELYRTMRSQIQSGICPAEFLLLVRDPSPVAPRGLAYDYLDDLVSGVFRFEPPAQQRGPLAPDSVFYQPTPARHIFHFIQAAGITRDDTLIDLGSGLGHVPLLTSICTGATTIGIESDSTLIATATKCARDLNLSKVTFLMRDAREADLSAGTVFYLYTPFTGSTLVSVLECLRNQAALRPIRICTFGPCTIAVSEQPWLKPITPPATDQVTVFFPGA